MIAMSSILLASFLSLSVLSDIVLTKKDFQKNCILMTYNYSEHMSTALTAITKKEKKIISISKKISLLKKKTALLGPHPAKILALNAIILSLKLQARKIYLEQTSEALSFSIFKKNFLQKLKNKGRTLDATWMAHGSFPDLYTKQLSLPHGLKAITIDKLLQETKPTRIESDFSIQTRILSSPLKFTQYCSITTSLRNKKWISKMNAAKL